MKKTAILLSGLLLLLGSCTPQNAEAFKWRDEWGTDPVTPEEPEEPAIQGKPRYVWIDAAANFQYYANDANYIAEDCKRIAKMGFTDIIVDVRPTTGDVLFQSAVAPACTKEAAWVNGRYRYVERTATFDYLATFLAAGHAAGLRVNAAINTMVGGYKSSLGTLGMLYNKPELKKWCSVDNLSGGLTNAMEDPGTGPRFLDPANPEVQEFLLTLLGELAAYEGLDGIVLDRCLDIGAPLTAYDGSTALQLMRDELPDLIISDITMPGLSGLELAEQARRICPACKIILISAYDKFEYAQNAVRFGVYVGAWFSEYYCSGVNWTSTGYDLKKNESSYKWVSANYQKTGIADLLDFIFLGAYAGTSGVHGSTEWTMEGFAKLGARRLAGAVPFAAGPDIGNGTGFENGHQEALIPDIVDTMLATSGGLFVFDLCHIRMFDYWDAFEKAIHAYLETL